MRYIFLTKTFKSTPNNFGSLYVKRNIVKVRKSRRMRLAGHVARMEEMRNNTFVTKPEGKMQPGRQRRRWKNIRKDLREIGSEVVDWMHLAQNRDQ
jgi:hypothetical protein